MKQFTLTLLIALAGLQAFAQDKDKEKDEPPVKRTHAKGAVVRPTKCPKFYITTSTGINNNTGLIGFSFDIPVKPSFSIETGVGLSSWGVKTALAGKYYLKPCQRGWAFGAGITYNTGIKDYKTNMETIYGNETVIMDLNPSVNIAFCAYHYWNLGQRNNRFYTQFGWSVPVSGGTEYDLKWGDPLSQKSKDMMGILSPGGLIAAVGFSFGIY